MATNERLIIRGRVEAQEIQQAPVKPTIILGIGGTGGDILLRIRKRFFERYGSLSSFPIVSYLWLDTDATEKDIGAGVFADQIAFSNTEKLMTTMADTTKVTSDLNNHPHIKQWFYPGLTKLKTMTEGAGQIRAYSRLGFFEHYTKIRNALVNASQKVRNIENIKAVFDKHKLDANPNELQVFVVFSVAGGTGSGMFLDLAFLVKDVFKGTALTSIGVIVMPGLFNPNEERIFANGYAALKELEYYSYEHDFEVEWPDMVRREIPGPPFNYTYLIDRNNLSNTAVEFANRDVIFNMVAENIFKDFTQSDFAGYKRGVRINLDQYLVDLFAFHHRNENGDSVIDQRFITRYGSFGMASITVPADRIEQACAYKLAADVVDHWGSLSNAGFNAASLTEEVLGRVLPRIGMYEGNLSTGGMIEQRRDIQNALLDDGHKQGQKIQNLISQAVSQATREVRDGVHAQRNQTMSQYLRQALEKELGKLRRDKGDPQQWGDYARAVHFNKEDLVRSAQHALHQNMGDIINEQHQSVGYAISLLRQMTHVLRDENREYIPSFERGREGAQKRADEAKRSLDQLFPQIQQHETGWRFNKKVILEADIVRFEELAPEYLNQLLLTQVRQAAVEVCQRIIRHIGIAEKNEETGEMLKEGLTGELYELGGQLNNLKERLMRGYEQFKRPHSSDLSLSLYDPSDIEQNYLPRYLGTGEAAREQKENIGDQILQELNTTVMDLPKLVRQRGIDSVELQIRDLCRRPFRNLKKDFDVIETFWKKYPNENERIKQVRFIYNNAKFWLNGGNRQRSFELQPERHKVVIGVPQDSADPIKLDEFRLILKQKMQEPGDPAISIQPMNDRSEIVFYSEVGGIPINWANAIGDLRQKYLAKQAEGEELHTDQNEIKFDDLVVLNERERRDLEESHECFLLGVIFGAIRPEPTTSGRVHYHYMKKRGLNTRDVSLGIEMKALSVLISNPTMREELLKVIRDREEQVKRDRDLMARFYGLLSWYADEVYPEKRVESVDGAEHIEQSNMCRAVNKHIDNVIRFAESQERMGRDSVSDFESLALKYRHSLDAFAPRMVDGKRALKFDEAEEASGNGSFS
jgi:hypothetical protein